MSIKDNISINARIFRNEFLAWYLGFSEKARRIFQGILSGIVMVTLCGIIFWLDEPPANDPGYVGGTYEATAQVVDDNGGYVIEGHLFRDGSFEGYQVGALVGITMNDGGTIDNIEDDKLAHIGE